MKEIRAFFYGTLMHPKILKRVIQNDGSHLGLVTWQNYTRHEVKSEDYPGIIPDKMGRTLFNRELDQEERSVRGVLVTGLTDTDMMHLDLFEGVEYTREPVEVHPLSCLTKLSQFVFDDDALVQSKPPPLPAPHCLASAIEAETYVYADEGRLEAELWSFEDFVKKNAWKWYSAEITETEVERRTAQGGER